MFSLNYFISFLSDFGKTLNEVASECEKKNVSLLRDVGGHTWIKTQDCGQ
jgi:hypothetical protein